MADAYILLSHQLSKDVQAKELLEDFRGCGIYQLPPELQHFWSQADVDDQYRDGLLGIIEWLTNVTRKGDYICVQGEWGLVYAVVSWSLNRGRIPIYASSTRSSVEERDNEGVVRKTSLFRHKRFALYERPWMKIRQE